MVMRFDAIVRVVALCTVAVVLMVGSTALAAPAISPAAKVQQTYAGINSLRTGFTQVLTHKESGSEEKRTGVLEFKKPLLVRWETKTPSPELLVVAKKEIWNTFSEDKIAYKYPVSLAEDSRSIIRVVTGQALLTQDYDVSPIGVGSDGLLQLRIYPRDPSESMTEGTLWVEEVSGLIKRVQVVDFYGNINDITMTSLEINAQVADDAFAYKPPAGWKVEDRTKDDAVTGKPLLR